MSLQETERKDVGKIVLYGVDISPPVRAVLFTLKALELDYEFIFVNLFAHEHLKENFLKHNPQHTVPLLDDNDTWVWDSHAICAYLVGKYAKNDSLYPKDLARRAIVDQRMYFDASILFMALRNISIPMFRNGVTIVPKEKTDNIVEGYELLEKVLVDNLYIAGNTLTIADFCCCATVSSLRGIVHVDIRKYPKTYAWLDRMSNLPYYDAANAKGVKEYVDILMSKLTEIIV